MKTILVLLLFVFSLSSYANEGKDLFESKCATCHKEDGTGILGEGPSLNNPDFLALANDDYLFNNITKGREGTNMRAFNETARRSRKLTAAQVKSIIAFMRSWQKPGFMPIKVNWKKTIKGSIVKGGKLFAKNCASCHGAKGEGYPEESKTPGSAIGRLSFLKLASDDYIKQTILRGRFGTHMPAFSKKHGKKNIGKVALKGKQINDIVAFVRSLAK